MKSINQSRKKGKRKKKKKKKFRFIAIRKKKEETEDWAQGAVNFLSPVKFAFISSWAPTRRNSRKPTIHSSNAPTRLVMDHF